MLSRAWSVAFRGVGTSKPGASWKFANLLGFLPKLELDTGTGETHKKNNPLARAADSQRDNWG